MKILIVTQYFWPENFRINDLVKGIHEHGHMITVLTGVPNYPSGKFFPGYGLFRNMRQNYEGIDVIRVPLVPRGKGGNVRLMLNYLSFALNASLLGPFLCRGKFDLIFVYEPSPITVGLPAIVLKKNKRAPVMFWALDLWPESLAATGAIKAKWLLGWAAKLVRFIYARCDRILVQSRAFIGQVSAMGADPGRILYFPNWAEELFQANDETSYQANPVPIPDGFRVMFAGNIGAAQDFGTILSAAEKLKEFTEIHWVIVGDGRMYSWVKQEVERRGLSMTVHMLGRHPLEAMPYFFSQADAMLASLRRDPIFSLTVPGKIQSYLAYGKPIIAALEGEGARIVDEAGAGLTCPPEDAVELANAVLTMYKKPGYEREAMGKRGKEYYAANFERGMLVTRLVRWMEELNSAHRLAADRAYR
jgi:glycosyltransferase involved in cell wall biosynthesis